jgi:hypothetical protein
LVSASPYTEMIDFNYSAPAELFGSPGRQRRSVTYRRFASGAEAVRFAVEGISNTLLPGVTLQADDDRFDHRAIRALYDSTNYPLTRQRRSVKDGSAQEESAQPHARLSGSRG